MSQRIALRGPRGIGGDGMSGDQAGRLAELFQSLNEAGREQLLAFAEFLVQRHGPEPASEPPAPVPIPRPVEETVVGAIKRLSATYPMLDRGRLLNETSMLMSQHVLQGRPAAEIIEDLETLFAGHYRDLTDRRGG